MRRIITRVLIATVAFLGVPMAMAGVAGAHTDTEAAPADAGRTRVSLTPEQECNDGAEPTSGLRVQLPVGTSDVQPESSAGWTAEVTASEVRWSSSDPGPGLTTFVVEMVLPQPPGSTVYLPTIQLCPGGEEIPWLQIPTVPGERLSSPAPSITVPDNATTPPTVSTTTTFPAASASEADTPVTSPPIGEEASAEESGPILWLALLAAAAVMLVSSVVFYVRRKRRTRS